MSLYPNLEHNLKVHAMATNETPATPVPAPQNPANIITALGNAFKSHNGEPITGERIAQLLAQNMGQLGELARQGKLNAQQIQQVRGFFGVCCRWDIY
jgi:transcription initiation factor TFIID subunit 12